MMTAAYEVSAAREPISAAEKMQQYFRDFRDFDIFEHRSFMPFLRVDTLYCDVTPSAPLSQRQ